MQVWADKEVATLLSTWEDEHILKQFDEMPALMQQSLYRLPLFLAQALLFTRKHLYRGGPVPVTHATRL